MGFFDDDDEESPPINMTPFAPTVAANAFQPINFMQLMDDVTGEEFSFVRGVDNSMYLEINKKIQDTEKQLKTARDRLGFMTSSDEVRNLEGQLVQLQNQAASVKDQPDSRGLKKDQIIMRTGNSRSRIPFDSIINAGNPDVALSEIGKFDVQYAGIIADISSRLRGLAETIQIAERTDPALLEQNKPILDAFRAANKQAMDKGFDIKQNGLDMKLAKMGLTNSSTAIGSQIALSRQRVDAEIDTSLKEAQLAQGLKQQSMSNMFKLGGQLVQEGGIGLGARAQDLAREGLEQQRSIKQAELNLNKEQQRINSEVQSRQIAAQLAISRNPMNFALPFLGQGNNQALQALHSDNNVGLGLQKNELMQSGLEQQKFRNDQAAQSNPLGQLAMTGLGAGLGGFAGFGGQLGAAKLFGIDSDTLFGTKKSA